jgi:hypothetical protein
MPTGNIRNKQQAGGSKLITLKDKSENRLDTWIMHDAMTGSQQHKPQARLPMTRKEEYET